MRLRPEAHDADVSSNASRAVTVVTFVAALALAVALRGRVAIGIGLPFLVFTLSNGSGHCDHSGSSGTACSRISPTCSSTACS